MVGHRGTNNRDRAGFTLIELMIVVIIIGVLAAIAVPAFGSYIYKSRASEATSFLAEIKQRQESYRSEFGQYASAPDDGSGWGTWSPSGTPGGQKRSFPNDTEWNELGAAPDGPVYFQYRTISGPPGTTPPGPSGTGYDGSDFWFVAQARGDLDEDGEQVTFEAYSAASHVWVSDSAGWD